LTRTLHGLSRSVESIQVQPLLGAVDTRLAKSGLLVEPNMPEATMSDGALLRTALCTALRTVLRTLLRVGYESVAMQLGSELF
jgi:hypothetical protein